MNLASDKRQQLMGMIAIVVLVIGFIIWYSWDSYYYPSTEDAYVQGDIVNIAAQVPGPVIKTYVQDYQVVKKGDRLFDIDPLPFQVNLARARAQLTETAQQLDALAAAVATAKAVLTQRQTELALAQKQASRILPLVKQGIVAKASGDDATARLNAAKAGVAAALSQYQQAQAQLGAPGDNNAKLQAAKAALAQAQLDLDHTRLIAPADGVVTNFSLRQGTMVSAQAPLFAIVERAGWVDANFKETDLARVHPGQAVKIKLDMYPHQTFEGQVYNISRGSGATFSLLPPENAAGNWVKVTQRFTVRIAIIHPNPAYPLRIGASTTVTIDTRHG